MRAYDIIEKKKQGGELTSEEIRFLMNGYVSGQIPDYQISAWAMAVYFRGMTLAETTALTLAMAESGEQMDLSSIPGWKVDKHSTGGVGDKTTLVVGPIVASLGVKVAKMSGRGLGHTGGTLDKLESIPGFNTAVSEQDFYRIVSQVGICIAGQTTELVPADRMLYALRDVTATVDSLPLIASSVMSKKLAGGSNAILLDVKTGSGAFMKTQEEAEELARTMIEIGKRAGRKMAALITDMDVPLGNTIGNALEVREAIETLQGKGPADFTEICLELAAGMLMLAEKGDYSSCREMAEEAVVSGKALTVFARQIQAQGGDPAVTKDLSRLPYAAYTYEVKAPFFGYVTHMDTYACGMAAVLLGAGRERKEDSVETDAGIVLCKKTGDAVQQGETLAVLHASKRDCMEPAAKLLLSAYESGPKPPAKSPHILEKIF